MAYNFSKVDVLVVESSPEMFKLIKMVLSLLSVPEKNVYAAFSIEEAYNAFRQKNHDLIITDWLENPDHGIQLVKTIRTEKNSPNIYAPIIMTAGSGHLSRVLRSRDVGVSEYLVKPFSAHALATRISRVIESPKPFVKASTYTGPERRNKAGAIDFPDRRKTKQVTEKE